MEKIGILSRSFQFLGDKIGENSRLAIDTVGAVALQPIAMFLGPGSNTEREKKTKEYQILRQPVSAALKLMITLAISIPVGRKLSKLALLGHYPSYMNSKFFVNTTSIKTMEDFVQKTGFTPQNTVQTNQLKRVLHLSHQIKQLHDRMILQSLEIDRYFTKHAGMLKKGTRLYTTENKINYLSNHPDLFSKDPALRRLISYYEKVQQTSAAHKQMVTDIISNVLFREVKHPQQLEKLKKVLVIDQENPYVAFQQIFQWCITLLMQPIVAYALNGIFPPFVKFVAPHLDQTVRSYNQQL